MEVKITQQQLSRVEVARLRRDELSDQHQAASRALDTLRRDVQNEIEIANPYPSDHPVQVGLEFEVTYRQLRPGLYSLNRKGRYRVVSVYVRAQLREPRRDEGATWTGELERVAGFALVRKNGTLGLGGSR